MKIERLFGTLLTLVLVLNVTKLARADLVEYSSGHADIGLAFEGGQLELHYHFGAGAVIDGSPLSGDVEYSPSEAYVRVRDSAKITVPFNTDFLGASAGDQVWVLPQTSTAGLPFVGLAAEELSAPFITATYQLIGFNGPANSNFALWQNSGLGTPFVSFRTNDGLSNLDRYNLSIGGHDHANWGFSKEGIYDLTILATVSDGINTFTDTGTFKFAVGDATAVPEPGSMLLMASVIGGTAWYKRRRKLLTSV